MMPLKTMVWSKYRGYLQTTTTFSTQCGDCEDCGEVPAHSCVPGSKCQLATVLSRWGIFSVRRISLTILCQLLSQAWNHHKTVLRLASLENGIGNLTEKVLSSEWHGIFVGCRSWSISSWLFIWALCLFAQYDLPQQGVWALNRPTWGGTTTFYRLGFNSGVPSGCFCQVMIVFLLKIRQKVETIIKQILLTLSDTGNINCNWQCEEGCVLLWRV